MKRLLAVLLKFVIIVIIVAVIVLISAAFDFGTDWEALKTDDYNFGAHLSLIVYRIALYLLPGTVLFLFGKIKGKLPNIAKSTFFESLNYQFAFYCLVKCVIVILGLDYIANLKLFNTMDSFIVVFGFVATWITKKATKFSKTEIIEKEIVRTGENQK